MASFLSGPAAQLVGAGMQAIGVGIPVGETSAKVINGLRGCGLPLPPKNWFKSKDSDAKEQQPQTRERRSSGTIYDKLESHINGVMQVVKPAIELKKLVRENCCKSAERPRRDRSQSPGNQSIYYTPQKCRSGACKLFDDDDEKSPSPKRKTATKKAKKCENRRCDSSDEEAHCMYCSRSKSLIKLPCGRLVCPKCDESGDHESECKRCRAAGGSRFYC